MVFIDGIPAPKQDGKYHNSENEYYDKYFHLHREDGPAIEYKNGDKSYYQYGDPHRLDGPAMEWKYFSHWYFRGTRIFCDSLKEFNKKLKLKAFW